MTGYKVVGKFVEDISMFELTTSVLTGMNKLGAGSWNVKNITIGPRTSTVNPESPTSLS